MQQRALTFRPLNFGRWVVWGLTAALFLLLPAYFNKGFALTLLSQMGITIIFALSYNMLLGQSGMLSFGHSWHGLILDSKEPVMLGITNKG